MKSNKSGFLIDIHVHASERSKCSRSTEAELIRAAIDKGLNALVFTDHMRLVPAAHLAELNSQFAPFLILGGVEMFTVDNEDILVYGVHDSRLEEEEWTYDRLYDFVREKNGFLVLAHPFRHRDYLGIDVETRIPDAMELRSLNIVAQSENKIRNVATAIGCGITCASDAHVAENVGAHCLRLDKAVATIAELISMLRTRAYSCKTLT